MSEGFRGILEEQIKAELSCNLELVSYRECLLAESIEKLDLYFDLLKIWNKKIDLVSPAPDSLLVSRHFVDSIFAYFALNSSGVLFSSVLDVGTGAGFPGLVWAILSPSVKFHLVEPREKRVSFLKEVRRLLDLNNVEIYQNRFEDLSIEGVDLITSRAVSSKLEFIESLRTKYPRANISLLIGKREGLDRVINGNVSFIPYHLQIGERHLLLVPNKAT